MSGARVKYLRQLAGLTQEVLASRLRQNGFRVTGQEILWMEQGQKLATEEFLYQTSRVLEIPMTYFVHENLSDVVWKRFRRIRRLSPETDKAIKSYANEIAKLQIALRYIQYPFPSHDLPKSTRVTLSHEAWGVSNGLRRAWDLERRPIFNLVRTAEERGVIVIGWQDASGALDCLGGWYQGWPVIVINLAKNILERRFSLAYALGHLMMQTEHVTDQQEDILADRFAEGLLIHNFYSTIGYQRRNLELGELVTLERIHGVSVSRLLQHAKDWRLIDDELYHELQAKLISLEWVELEPIHFRSDEEPLQLKLLAYRAIADGLINPDRLTCAGVDLN